MEEVSQEKGKDIIKIEKPTEKKLLKKITKTDEWEKVKDIKDIYNEIQDYGIEKEDIGLNCAKYLNKVGETGKFEIEELYNTCYKLKAYRQRRKKKEKKEKAPKAQKGKAGKAPAQTKPKDPDIDSSKAKSVEGLIDKALKDATDENGNIDYAKLFQGVSKEFCSGSIKSGLKGIYDSLTKNYESINQVGWTSAGWEFGKDLGSELFKMVASCGSDKLIQAFGSSAIGAVIAYWSGLYGKIKRLVSREGNPPSGDDDDQDGGGEGVGGVGVSGGLTRRTPQPGSLTYLATDVEGERVSNLQNAFSQLLQQQRQRATQQAQSAQSDKLEKDIKETDAFSSEKPKDKPPEKKPEEREEELTPPKPKDRVNRGGFFGSLGGEKTGREGLKEFGRDALTAYSIYKAGSKLYDFMNNPLVAPEPLAPQRGALFEEAPDAGGLGGVGGEFQDAQEGPDRTEESIIRDLQDTETDPQRDKKPSVEERIQQELDEKERIGKGLATAMLMGGQGGKLAQATLNPLVLYLRGTAENPTLKLKSVQSQTEQKTSAEDEAILKQKNEDLDVINSIIEQSNQDVKPTQEQYDLRKEQEELMRKVQTNTTPVIEETDLEVEKPDISDTDADIPAEILEEIIRKALEEQQIQESRNKIIGRQEGARMSEEDMDAEIPAEILEEIKRVNEIVKQKQQETLREYSLKGDNPSWGNLAELQAEAIQQDPEPEEQSLYPRVYRPLPERAQSRTVGFWDDYLRQFFPEKRKIRLDIRDLRDIDNPIINEAIREIDEYHREERKRVSAMPAPFGREIMERLENARLGGNRPNIPMRERAEREKADKTVKKKKK